MSTVHLMPPRAERPVDTTVVGRLLLLASLCLMLQVGAIDLGSGGQVTVVKTMWLAAGLTCLWLLHRRRSALARAFILVAALVPALQLGFSATVEDGQVLIAVACLVQAIVLVTPSVRAHVSR